MKNPNPQPNPIERTRALKNRHAHLPRAALRGPAFFLALLLCASALAQVSPNAEARDSGRRRALASDQSSAERAAEDMVALSPDTIVGLLREEPGLLLQAKRALVRKAYEQGRLLDPQELDDDALFRLIQEDQSVRVLMTKEIEDRYYIRAKPRRQELEDGMVFKSPAAGTKGPARNQEEAFWTRHERAPEYNPEPLPETQPAAPGGSSGQPAPDSQPASGNPRLDRTQAQPPFEEPERGSPNRPSGAFPRIRPDEIPGLLTVGAGDKYRGAPGQDQDQDMDTEDAYPSGGDGAQPSRPGNEASPATGIGPYSGSSSGYPGGSSGAPAFGSSLDVPDRPGSSSAKEPYPSRMARPYGTRTMPRKREIQPDQRGLHHRPNPYADVPSLYDLYAQYSGQPAPLQRFGLDVFRNGTGNFDQLPMDMPVGPEYVLGPGDGLSIDLWGGALQRVQRVVDRQGRISLPEIGAVQVAGRSLGDAQHLVQAALRTQFRDVEADLSLSRLRTVRVYVVGDVERPGAYDVSSLSTPLNAVYEAGGPTARGSLRILRHYRGPRLLQEIDVYDLLLHGIRSDLEGLQPGDSILVPPLGPEVTIEGMVRRPAIYELAPAPSDPGTSGAMSGAVAKSGGVSKTEAGDENNLAEVLELAGGVLQSGTLRHVDVERVEAHLSRSMLRLDIPEDSRSEAVARALEDFKVQDGDKIKISPILPYADQAVYLEGHVFRPGKFAYREGMRISDMIGSYSDLLPEPDKRHAEIIRLTGPDHQPVVLAFNLDQALAGKNGKAGAGRQKGDIEQEGARKDDAQKDDAQDLALKPFDTVRVFSRYDFEDPPVITVNGEVRDPGDHVTNGATYLRDAVFLAGGTTPDAQLRDAQIFRKTENGKLKVIGVNLAKALAGDAASNILLESKDRVFIHKSATKADPATVKVEGEVERPGKYPLGEEMTAADLVRVAGGFKRGAYTEAADLTTYAVERGAAVAGEHRGVPIGRAMAGEADTDVRLHDGDVLTIRQLAGWNDMGATIAVRGEVVHPGTYGIKEGERLSSILARAGGLRGGAYPYGAVFERAQVRALEESNRTVLLREVSDDGLSLKAAPDSGDDDKKVKEASLLQWQRTMEKLQNTPPNGRLVVHLSKDVKRWANTPADIEVRAGDSIYIPKRPNLVMVDGSVYNPTAVTYKPGKSAGWYLRQAGGPTTMANQRAVFVIRADGSVAGGSGGLFTGGAERAELRPGDMVVVPEKAFSGTTKWKNTLQMAQLLQAVAFSVSLGRSF